MSQNLEQVRELLPPAVRRIAELVGLPAAIKLVEALGGTSWYFARGVGRHGQARVAALSEIVGDEAAERLAFYLHERDTVYIPKCDTALRSLRDIEIHRQFDQAMREGISANTVVAELARTYELSDRHVWRILKVLPHTSPGAGVIPDLFD
ncbi:Mor transcription activator family protein [Pseudomonas alcaligenes]|uniref:Mor transcription activator family protein n=1 Tax=Aquipseudomonas alcaligenes TaxID=43263 RepID=UPI002E7BBBFE|nr:Mor transcription activator family protein [Pseudomonas alcaligenes]MEE1950993.1 Mor transcription activator family protein [Pseudomonas alcaligenes]